jgi:dipeptidyl aminopeptidase/acylaminoacyl peptidase
MILIMKRIILFVLPLLLFACVRELPVAVPTYSIEQFYGNTRVGGGFFSPDESKLLVSSDESGIFNVYEIDISSGDKKQFTSSREESFFAVDYVPSTGEVLYSADKGGDENNHIFLLGENGEVTDLTPGEKEKAQFAGWNKEKTHLYYVSNKRDPRYFDLYKMPAGDWKESMLYQNDEGMEVAGISYDEKTVALVRNITTSSNQLFLRNTTTGETVEISQEDKPGAYNASGFSNDGSRFYYTTNADKEFTYLVEYDIASKSKKTIFETNWDVVYSSLSENEKYRVILVNEDGRNQVILLDNSTGQKVDFPGIPDADVLAIEISDTEQNMRLTVGSSKAPSNIYVYNFESQELKKLTETLNSEINPAHLVSAEVIRYPSFDGLEIPAIYYKPLNASDRNKVPGLVWVHGGPGDQSRTGYFPLIQFLVNNGYAVLAVNNRGSSGYGKTFYQMDDRDHGGGDLQDCIWGKNWLQEQNYIDGDKIGIIGGSYGGYMTMAAMAFEPDEFKVGVNIFGVTNWLRTLKSIPPYWEAYRKALYDELGDPYTEDSVRLYKISPLFHAHQVKNPVMVLQGANDPRVLQVESDEIVEAVKKNNVPVEYIVFPDEGHGFMKKENEIRGYGQILTFLDTYLK